MDETENAATMLDLSRRDLVELSDDLPNAERLQCLYLEGNKLTELPAFFFDTCCNLTWLDVRNNMLKALPPAVRHFRSLRTLLLEGNQLTHLPRELAELTHLTALNLSRNPIHCPPQCVIARGTKAILEYLRGLPAAEGHVGNIQPVSNPVLIDGPLYPLSERLTDKEKPTTRDATSETHYTPRWACPSTQQEYPSTQHESPSTQYRLPGPVPRQALLHTQPPPYSRKDGSTQSLSKCKLLPARRKPRVPEFKKPRNEPSTEVKQEIAVVLQREKDRQCLDDWKEESKRLQRQQQIRVSILNEPVDYTKAVESAPYATEANSHTLSPKKSDTNHIEPGERAKKIAAHLQEQRTMLGLRQAPSKELIDAEVRLAEVLLKREELEVRKKREYRLTAFTGDLQ
ncbi:hypothetical protein EMCRGX_G029468 [Ephydatia muelleri]